MNTSALRAGSANTLCKAVVTAIAFLACLSMPAPAAPISYVLTGATLNGDPLTGGFTVDESTATLSAVNIFSSFLNITFNTPVGVGPSAILVGNASGQDLVLSFYDALALVPDAIFETNANFYPTGLDGPSFNYFASGFATPAPLPPALPLFIAGLTGIGLLSRLRKPKTTSL